MQVQTEQNQQDSSYYKCTTAHELKKVEAFTRGALHDGLYADERNQGQNHLGDLEAAERAAQVVGVAAQAGQPAALAHRLGGGLVRAAGAGDHGGARGLALEAVQLLAAPHAGGRAPRPQLGLSAAAASLPLGARRPPPAAPGAAGLFVWAPWRLLRSGAGAAGAAGAGVLAGAALWGLRGRDALGPRRERQP